MHNRASGIRCGIFFVIFFQIFSILEKRNTYRASTTSALIKLLKKSMTPSSQVTASGGLSSLVKEIPFHFQILGLKLKQRISLCVLYLFF
jgi:preprotein translocase subunit YajC